MAATSSFRAVGVLGGMGPLATVDYLKKIIEETPANCDQDHVPYFLASIPQTPDRTASILRGALSPINAMLLGIRSLEQAGAGCVTIACNTAHHWSDEIVLQTELPLLHIADAVVTELTKRASYGDSIGILSTAGTIKSGFFQERLSAAGYRVLMSTASEFDEWVSPGIQLVKQGDVAAGGRLLGFAALALRERRCDKLIFACTEIPFALASINHESLAYGLDATRALARSAVTWWENQSR